jgi:hypothetical protein
MFSTQRRQDAETLFNGLKTFGGKKSLQHRRIDFTRSHRNTEQTGIGHSQSPKKAEILEWSRQAPNILRISLNFRMVPMEGVEPTRPFGH